MSLEDEQEKREVKIRTCIIVETRRDLFELLQEFKDIFAWSYRDMPGLNIDIVVHRLLIKEECKPVNKQFDTGFLHVVKYSEWVANIVPILKKDGKVRMCVDYRELNKASPKDNFTLPYIDTLVDNTEGHSLFSFMDGFSGYNQINMHPEDMEKATFIIIAMVTLFHDMLHKEIEVYVDDMIAKSRTKKEHEKDLRKLFLRFRKF
ncbi:RNA-directed DNA polymerase (Reverse transcriptase), Ribonuclease H-like protein [Gossypium australe]|uniref:RNA-directed DNA polymerase (Reverse transcriptase), Ribonuclease H-like protein n=1 Tax=Gossypium australe TaxID=47621 RepID=A0A5B6VL24_9ROSI|nr:RNA-directed DNA polymerase (Reverse transcriptase), Ribonuclease H-like protein [Gossypium australe]